LADWGRPIQVILNLEFAPSTTEGRPSWRQNSVCRAEISKAQLSFPAPVWMQMLTYFCMYKTSRSGV
jgi:hypothetical protein